MQTLADKCYYNLYIKTMHNYSRYSSFVIYNNFVFKIDSSYFVYINSFETNFKVASPTNIKNYCIIEKDSKYLHINEGEEVNAIIDALKTRLLKKSVNRTINAAITYKGLPIIFGSYIDYSWFSRYNLSEFNYIANIRLSV